MDILLRQKFTYSVPYSFESTRNKLEAILNNKWYDLSKKYHGNIDEEGNFTIKKKISFFSVANFGSDVSLKGNLTNEINGTSINITLSPNWVFIFVIYLLPLIGLNILFGDNSLMGQKNGRLNNFMSIAVLEVIIFIIAYASMYFSRRRFETDIIEDYIHR